MTSQIKSTIIIMEVATSYYTIKLTPFNATLNARMRYAASIWIQPMYTSN